MSDFDRGYLYGLIGASLVFLLWDFVDAMIQTKPAATKLVVLDRRDMRDNADVGASDRMAGSNQGTTNP